MDILNRYEIERDEEWRRWCKEIPYIKFDKNWEVKVIPPVSGAIVRFRVKHGSAESSIYLDCYDKLGCFGEPYWEVYPHEGDVYRCKMEDTNSLLSAVSESIAEQQ